MRQSDCSLLSRARALATLARMAQAGVPNSELHKSEYEVLDDWQVLGMRATRSMIAVAEDSTRQSPRTTSTATRALRSAA